MSSLRICQAVSLNPSASKRDSALVTTSRTCLMGCLDVAPTELRRFPTHDTIRCSHWLRHFGISSQLVEKLGGLPKLRICPRHFSKGKSKSQAMAKTRIKMTPLRKSSKGILTTSSAAVAGGGGTPGGSISTTTTIDAVKSCPRDQAKRSVDNIMTLPPRSHSISSSASSDVQSISSDYEASLPISSSENSQNGKSRLSENGQPKKRKLYLITEKSNGTNGHAPEANGQSKKRKMLVVVEQEKESAGKKLMIVADKSQANLTQHLEKLLPEILNRMQDKEPKQATPNVAPVVTKPAINRPHITLPPKKNPTNFVKVASSPSPVPCPVPSPPIQMPLPIQTPKFENEMPINVDETETNINLSPDFRFLMKILPKLEKLPEPHKQNVKRSIQIFIEKSYSIYGKKD